MDRTIHMVIISPCITLYTIYYNKIINMHLKFKNKIKYALKIYRKLQRIYTQMCRFQYMLCICYTQPIFTYMWCDRIWRTL